jgi:hypothetical protein
MYAGRRRGAQRREYCVQKGWQYAVARRKGRGASRQQVRTVQPDSESRTTGMQKAKANKKVG